MPRPLAGAGRLLEARVAPPFYRRTEMVTPSEATRDELIELGFRAERVTAVDNGVEPYFSPGGASAARRRSSWRPGGWPPSSGSSCSSRRPSRRGWPVPDLRAARHRRRSAAAGAAALVRDHGHWDGWSCGPRGARRAARAEYRRAWVVASGSLAEGWGLTLTEARGLRHACGGDGHPRPPLLGRRRPTGVLARAGASSGDALAAVLLDGERRARLGDAARARAPR